MRTLLTCAAWLPATAALAIGEPPKVVLKPAPPEGAPAVAPPAVEATTPAELRKQTYSFVDTFAAGTPKLDQIARWDSPLCVTVQGLPSDEGAKIKARVEDVAKALGLHLAGRTCGPNLEIKFSAQPQGFLDQVAATHEDMLGYWHRRDRDNLKAVTRPIQAWYRTATIGAGGTTGMAFGNIDTGNGASPTAVSPGVAGAQASGEIIDDPDTRAPTGCGNSRFSACLRSTFNHVLVMVDTNAVNGVPAGLVGDYIVVLALSQPRSLDGCNALKSVIDVFASGCAGRAPPDGLTRADVAYLTSLYKADPEAKRASQQTDIAGRMADMLLKANATDRLVVKTGAR
ncbi:MAG: hypothetical protein ACXWKY_12655 [Caulobacteraceae bacterium]